MNDRTLSSQPVPNLCPAWIDVSSAVAAPFLFGQLPLVTGNDFGQYQNMYGYIPYSLRVA